MKWNNLNEKPNFNELVIVSCPDFNSEGYAVCYYCNGEYELGSYGDITEYVKAWAELDEYCGDDE
jgi:hypothetical protein